MQKSKKSKNNGNYISRQQLMKSPPPFKSEIVVSRKIRFKATAAVSEIGLAPRELAMAVAGIVAVSTTTSGVLARAIRLRKVEAWFVAATAGTPVEAVIDWNSSAAAGGTYSPTSSVQEVAMSTAEYSHLKSSPPPLSAASLWHDGSDTTGIMTLTLPAGGIVDITCDFVYNDSNAVLSGASISGATVGLWYHKQPDPNLVVLGNLNTIA